MNRNLSLTKLLFEEENTEGRLKLREKLPNSSLMSNSIISHNDIQNIICPKIAKSIQGEAKIKKAMTFYAKLESAMKKSKETDINKLYSKMNEKAQKEFNEHLEVAKTNLGYLDQKIIQRLFLKNTNMGRAGKTHVNPVQLKPGADQVEGAYEVDLQIYEDLQVVTFFMSNIDSETLTNFGSQGKHLVMYLAPGSCMFVKKENVELFNEAFITDPDYKITSDDQIFWAYEKVAFVYIKPEEIPKLQANPRKEIMRLLSLVGSRKGNKTNIEADDEDQKLDREGDEDRPESSEEKKDQESVKLNSQKDTSRGGEKEVKEESYIYKRGITSILSESQAAGRTIAIDMSTSSSQGSLSQVSKELSVREKDFIRSHVNQISSYTAGKFDELSNYNVQLSKKKFSKIGTGVSFFAGGVGMFVLSGFLIPAALGVWIASDEKGIFANLYSKTSRGAGQKISRQRNLQSNIQSMSENAFNQIVTLIESIKEKQDEVAFDPARGVEESDKIEVNLGKNEVSRILDQFKDLGSENFDSMVSQISSEVEDFEQDRFIADFDNGIYVKINYILSAFGARIDEVELQDAKTSFTNDFVSQIVRQKQAAIKAQQEHETQLKADDVQKRADMRKRREDQIARKFAGVKKDDFEFENPNDARSKQPGSQDPLPAHEVLEKILDEINEKRKTLKSYSDEDIQKLYTQLNLNANKKTLGNLLIEKKKDNSFSNLSNSEKKKVIEYLTSKKLETFLDAIEAINYCDDIELITSMFTYIHSEPNDFAKTFDSLRNEKSDLNKALSKLGDLNKIKKLLKQKERKASSKQKKRKEKEDKIKKAAGKKLGVKTESVDLRKEWLRLWDI